MFKIAFLTLWIRNKMVNGVLTTVQSSSLYNNCFIDFQKSIYFITNSDDTKQLCHSAQTKVETHKHFN